ncbi:hypothetical protein HZS_7476, partial [Henneguya salminicola]
MKDSTPNNTPKSENNDDDIKDIDKFLLKTENDILQNSMTVTQGDSTREIKSINTADLNSPTSSDKESIGDLESIRSREIKKSSTKYLKKCRKIEIEESNNASPLSESYYKRVEALRKDLESTLSKWILSARNQVNDSFYETVRQAFESFMQEIEHYQSNVPAKTCENERKSQKYFNKHEFSEKDISNENKPREYCVFQQKKSASGSFLASAIAMADHINTRLNHLILELSKYKRNIGTNFTDEKKYKLQSNKKKKIAGVSTSSPGDIDHLLNYIESKLRKYRKKYGNICTKVETKKGTSSYKGNKSYFCDTKDYCGKNKEPIACYKEDVNVT